MENASKALLIAGGILITMIVVTIGVNLYSVFHEHSENMLARMSEKEISEFNAQFVKYEEQDLTINEVVTLMNLVRDNNKTKTGEEYRIEIDFNNGSAGLEFSSKANECMAQNKEVAYQEKCNNLISSFSNIKKIDVTSLDGATEPKMVYEYVFSCKINTYHQETSLVEKITITARLNS